MKACLSQKNIRIPLNPKICKNISFLAFGRVNEKVECILTLARFAVGLLFLSDAGVATLAVWSAGASFTFWSVGPALTT